MKNNLCLLFAVFAAFQTQAQDVSVEKSIYNIQAGVLGAYASNEFRLNNSFALRTEIGLDAAIFGGDFYNRTGLVLTPVITVEPRWYYNLERRNDKGKNTGNNSGNFVAIGVDYNPDWFVISNYDDINVISQLSVIPKWGIRRSIGKSNFNYEAGIGLGFRYEFLKEYGFAENELNTVLDLHLRIGYTFPNKKK